MAKGVSSVREMGSMEGAQAYFVEGRNYRDKDGKSKRKAKGGQTPANGGTIFESWRRIEKDKESSAKPNHRKSTPVRQ